MDFRVDRAVEILTRTPSTLRSMLAELSEPWVMTNYGDETFSPFDVVGHLIHGERTDWMPRARIILEHGESKSFEPFDRFAMYEASQGKTISALLDTFESLRCDNLQALQDLQLKPQQLTLRGTHPELGTVTLENLLATWAVHDLNHLAQIAKAMSFQYRDAVGPWLQFASILRR